MPFTTQTGTNRIITEFAIQSAETNAKSDSDVVGFADGSYAVAFEVAGRPITTVRYDANNAFVSELGVSATGAIDPSIVLSGATETTVVFTNFGAGGLTNLEAFKFDPSVTSQSFGHSFFLGPTARPDVAFNAFNQTTFAVFTDPDFNGIYFDIRNASGAQVSNDFVGVGGGISGTAIDASVAVFPSGNVFTSFVQGATGNPAVSQGDLAGRFFSPTGVPTGSEFLIYAASSPNGVLSHDSFTLANGGWGVVVDNGTELYLKVYNSSSVELTPPGGVRVDDSTKDELDPSVTIVDGQYIVVSYTEVFSTSDLDARYSIFDLNGVAVNLGDIAGVTGSNEDETSIAGLADGKFITTFTDDASGTDEIRAVIDQIVRTHTGTAGVDNSAADLSLDDDNIRDILNGLGDNDTLAGFGGQDDHFGGAGDDRIVAFDGDDAFGAEVYDGGTENDTFFWLTAGGSPVFDVRDDTVTSIENFSVFDNSAAQGTSTSTLKLLASQIPGDPLNTAVFGYGDVGPSTIIYEITIDEAIADFSTSTHITSSGSPTAADQFILNATPGVGGVVGPQSFASTINGADGSGSILSGGNFDDIINAGNVTGTNQLTGGGGGDVLRGGSGTDFALYLGSLAGVNVQLQYGIVRDGEADGDTLFSIEGLVGSDMGDVLTGNPSDNTLVGLGGDDFLRGLNGADVLDGRAGDDWLYADNLDTQVLGGDDTDRLFVANRNDFTIDLFASAIEIATGNIGSDTFDGAGFGSGTSLTLRGRSGNDILTGGAGNDRIYGDAGADELRGGLGDDFLFIDNADTVIDAGGGSADRLVTVGTGGVSVNVAAANAEVVFGGAGSDFIDGSGATVALSLYGRSDSDTLTGGSLNDRLFGDGGQDILSGGLGNDFLRGGLELGGAAEQDQFFFADDWGSDRIFDFADNNADGDIELLDFSSVAGITGIGDLSITQETGFTRITYTDGAGWTGSIRLDGILANNLGPDDFNFT